MITAEDFTDLMRSEYGRLRMLYDGESKASLITHAHSTIAAALRLIYEAAGSASTHRHLALFSYGVDAWDEQEMKRLQ